MPGGTTGYEAPKARFLVTNKASEAVTYLDRIALRAVATHTLNAPFELEIDVPSDHPQVNLHAAALDPLQPYIDEGLNMIYWFLRWGTALSDSDGPWECMGAGIILSIDDHGDAGNPISTIHAYDPWKLLYHIPICNSDGTFMDDVIFPGDSRASEVAVLALQFAETGFPDWRSRIDVDPGNIEATDPIPQLLPFQAGTSVGEVFDSLVETGTIDIILKPIFDPITRPGKLAELHIHSRKGIFRPEAIFSYDRWPRSVMEISRTQDGTERANEVAFYAGQSGAAPLINFDDPSIAKYGIYFESQSWPAQENAAAVAAMSYRELRLKKNGVATYELTPAGERAPLPFKEYDLGDTVPVWASKRLRRPIVDTQLRVQAIPMELDADQLMRVTALTVTDDVTP